MLYEPDVTQTEPFAIGTGPEDVSGLMVEGCFYFWGAFMGGWIRDMYALNPFLGYMRVQRVQERICTIPGTTERLH